MAKLYQDFVGLNTLVYEPCGWEEGYVIEAGSGYLGEATQTNFIAGSYTDLNKAYASSNPIPTSSCLNFNRMELWRSSKGADGRLRLLVHQA